jgi:hypothetical protein
MAAGRNTSQHPLPVVYVRDELIVKGKYYLYSTIVASFGVAD